MDSAPLIFAKLYLPMMLSSASLLLLLKLRKGEKRILVRLKPFADFIDFEVSISDLFVLRLLVITAVAAFFSSYTLYDYSALFPQHYRMEVFYDESGLDSSLDTLSPNEVESLGIPKNSAPYRDQYFKQLDSDIQRTLGAPQFFSVREGYAHSAGEAYTTTEKLEGWQNYHINESRGELTHTLEVPNLPPKEFYTRFEKLPSRDDYLELTLADLFIRHSVLVRTQYKQVLVESKLSNGSVFKLRLEGVTRVTIFPWPRVSNTVYLAKFENVGLVPVAYAVYR